MNPNQNTGSFGGALPGGADPIMAALAARQTGQAGVTDQSSMSQTPMPQPAQGPVPGQPQPVQSPQALPGMPEKSSDTRFILEALEGKLKRNDKLEEMKLTGGGM